MPLVLRPGATLHYVDRGPRDARAVVLLPSLLCDAGMFDHLANTIDGRYRVLGVDMRGHGRSTAERAFTMEEQAGDIPAILDDAGVSRATLVGLSQGGMAAIRAAVYHAPRVSALALLDSSAEPEGAFVRTKYLAMAASFRLLGFTPALARGVKPLMFSDGFLRSSPDVVEAQIARWNTLDGRGVYYATRNVALRTDARPLLSRIHVPTLVLVGTGDRALPPARSQALARGIEGARYVEIPGAGHLSTIERPEATTREVLRFLDESRPSLAIRAAVVDSGRGPLSISRPWETLSCISICRAMTSTRRRSSTLASSTGSSSPSPGWTGSESASAKASAAASARRTCRASPPRGRPTSTSRT